VTRLSALAALVIGCASTALAQSSPTPRERAVRAVVDSFFDAVRRERYDEAARFVILEPFERQFRQTIRNMRSAIPVPRRTPEELMATDSTMPRAVAEWQANQLNEMSRRNPLHLHRISVCWCYDAGTTCGIITNRGAGAVAAGQGSCYP
jgi:hypothetical protein